MPPEPTERERAGLAPLPAGHPIALAVLRDAWGWGGECARGTIGAATLYLGDCREVLPTLGGGCRGDGPAALATAGIGGIWEPNGA